MAYHTDPNTGIRTAGTVAVWLWILITVVPIALIAMCVMGTVFACGAGTVFSGPSEPTLSP